MNNIINNWVNKHQLPKSLLIIGNGFDLSIGLRSSFIQFFGLNQIYGTYHTLSLDVKKFRMSCRKFNKHNNILNVLNYKNFVNLRKSLFLKNNTFSEFSDILKVKEIYQKINHINNLQNLEFSVSDLFQHYIKDRNIFGHKGKFNFWSLYFCVLHLEGNPDWYDVEDEIHNFLVQKNGYYNKICLYLYDLLRFNNGKDKRISSQIQDNSNISLSIDIDIIIYAIIRESLTDKSSLFISIFKNIKPMPFNEFQLLFNKYLKEQLHQFEYDLNDYLLKCIKHYSQIYGFTYYSMGKELLQCLTNNSQFLSLLNFNYTDPTDESKICKYRRNIHGILNQSHDTRISPIIGISDPKIHLDDSSNSIYSFTKDYRILRLSCNNYSDFLQNEITNIRFFGHSFDNEDRHYFYDIFDKYNIMSGHIKLIFYYRPHDGQNDNSGAIKQINLVLSLFKGYFTKKYKKRGLQKAVKFMDVLSLSGQLIIANIDDEIKRHKKLSKKFRIVDDMQRFLHESNVLSNKYNKDSNGLKKYVSEIRNNLTDIVKETDKHTHYRKMYKNTLENIRNSSNIKKTCSYIKDLYITIIDIINY